MRALYAVYDDDEFIDMGTVNELAERLDVKPATIKFWTSRQARERSARIAIRVEQDEEENTSPWE